MATPLKLKLTPSKAKPKYGVSIPGAKDRPTTSRPPSQIAAPKGPIGHPLVQPSAAAPVAAVPTAAAVVANPSPAIESDPTYQAALAAITKGRDDAILQLENQRGTIKSQYGIEDTSDPYSRAKLLHESLKEALRGSNNSMASRGLLYAGANQNAQNIDQRNFNVSYDNLTKDYQNKLTGITNAETNARNNAQSQIGQVAAEALSRYLATRPDPTEPDAGGASGAGPSALAAPGGQAIQNYKGVNLKWDPRGFWAGPAKGGGTYHLYPQTVNGKPKVVVVK